MRKGGGRARSLRSRAAFVPGVFVSVDDPVPISFADEAFLARACSAGDPAAWRTFIDRYGRLVQHVARRTAEGRGARPGPAELDDLCAEVFLALVKDGASKLRAYDPRWALSTYVGAIARSATIDALRAGRLGGRGGAPVPGGRTGVGEAESVEAPGSGPAEAALRAESARAVESALAALAPRDRLVVRLFYHGGFRYREIATMLGIPLNTVCSTLARALEKLRDRMA
jgi:RNA polymerase sigma-70 factor (ECF subfamily)